MNFKHCSSVVEQSWWAIAMSFSYQDVRQNTNVNQDQSNPKESNKINLYYKDLIKY